jgi:hypothetical protein
MRQSDPGFGRLIVVRFHRETATSLSEGADLGRVAEHLGKRDQTADNGSIVEQDGLMYLSSSRSEIFHDRTEAICGGSHLQLHHRLQHDRLCLYQRIPERQAERSQKRNQRIWRIVMANIENAHLDINNRIAMRAARIAAREAEVWMRG